MSNLSKQVSTSNLHPLVTDKIAKKLFLHIIDKSAYDSVISGLKITLKETLIIEFSSLKF